MLAAALSQYTAPILADTTASLWPRLLGKIHSSRRSQSSHSLSLPFIAPRDRPVPKNPRLPVRLSFSTVSESVSPFPRWSRGMLASGARRPPRLSRPRRAVRPSECVVFVLFRRFLARDPLAERLLADVRHRLDHSLSASRRDYASVSDVLSVRSAFFVFLFRSRFRPLVAALPVVRDACVV